MSALIIGLVAGFVCYLMVAKVKARLNELRLRMPAYYAESMPGDPGSRRKLFAFAKGLGADMIVAPVEPASLAELDKLANELAMNVAVVSRGDPKSALAARPRSRHNSQHQAGQKIAKDVYENRKRIRS